MMTFPFYLVLKHVLAYLCVIFTFYNYNSYIAVKTESPVSVAEHTGRIMTTGAAKTHNENITFNTCNLPGERHKTLG